MFGRVGRRRREHRASAGRTPAAAALTVGSLLVLACARGGDDETHADVAGSWEGTWSTTWPAPSGDLTLTLEQTGATVTGAVAFAGHPCFGPGTVACGMHGMHLSGRFESGGTVLTIDADCTGHHATHISGSYRIGPGGSCAGEQGTFQLDRVEAGTRAGPALLPAGTLYLLDPQEGEPRRFPLWRLGDSLGSDSRPPSRR